MYYITALFHTYYVILYLSLLRAFPHASWCLTVTEIALKFDMIWFYMKGRPCSKHKIVLMLLHVLLTIWETVLVLLNGAIIIASAFITNAIWGGSGATYSNCKTSSQFLTQCFTVGLSKLIINSISWNIWKLFIIHM